MAVLEDSLLGVDAKEASPKRAIVLVGLALFVLYALTATYTNFYGTDAFTNAAFARALADDQSVVLEELEGLETPQNQGIAGWFVESPQGTVAQYPPLTALLAAPLYTFNTDYEETSFTTPDGRPLTVATPVTYVPASVTSALSVAIAMVFFGLTLSRVMPGRATLLAMAVGGLGTGAWSVASDRLWQHGPAMMCISIGTYFASRDRFVASGLAFGAGVLIRPHTVVVAALIGIAVAINRRSIREMLALGTASFLGVVALALYNNAVFGDLSISGGYGGGFADRVVGSSPLLLVQRMAEAFVHLRVGILWSSPFIALSLWALVKHRKSSPDWAVGAALGAVAYLVIQFRANRVTGGDGFFGYRYLLEALMAAGPMLAYSTWLYLQDEGIRRRLFAVLAIASGGFHATNFPIWSLAF